MDLIFGLTEGWWRFADHALRPNYPLLSTDKWQKLLLERGFERAEIIGYGQENQEGLSQQALIVAQMPQIEAPEVTSEARNWLIMADNQGLGRQLATHLRAEGAVCTLAFPGQAYEQLAEFEFRLNPANPIDFEQLLATMTANRSPLHKVVHLWSLAAAEAETLTLSDLEAASLFGCGSALHLIQALLKAELPASPSVWLVTRDAQPAGARPPLSGIAQSPLWGMGKVIALEHPDLWGGMIDLPPEASKEEAAALLAEIKEPDEEDLVAFRVGGRYVPRLVRSSRPELPRSPFQMDGTYLITGGLGGLGLKVAQWLVGQGAQHLVLVGRSAPSEATKEVISHLSQAGIQILVTQADVSRVEEMGRVFEQISPAWPPLRGIVHAAGVARYQAIRALDFKALQTVFRPKVMGTWTLHQLTKEKKLDFLVSFSSMVSVWGAKKQGDYVAANHFLDTFAHYRRSIGLSALSVNWGPFSSGGLLSAEALVSLAQMGVAALSPEQVVEALGYLLGVDCTQITVAKIDWPIYRRLYETRGERPLLKEIAVPSPETIKRQRGRPSKILQRLTAATPNERPSLLIAHLQAEVAKVLGLEPPQLPDRERGFFEMGMDSLMAVELKRRLEVDFDTTLSTTLAFDFPTIKHLADYLVGEVLRWELGETNNTDLTKAEDEPNEVLRGLEQLVEDKIEASITQKLAKLETLLRST
jgi:NAD(P)-dependent dehydrogenase (short-subunit alcohol dehydrogenase family)/acyl carrier protein